MKNRAYPDQPWLGVGGIIFQGETVLLVKRGKEPGRGRWSIPGGAVDVGESVAAAVQREIEEETGLKVTVGELVEVFERIIPDPQGKILYHYVLLDYLCQVTGGRLRAFSDALEVGFFPLEALESLNTPRETVRVIRKAFDLQQKTLDNSPPGK